MAWRSDAVAMVPNLPQREFTAPMPGLRLTGDISCFPTGEGWLYVATVLDLCSKGLIGYAVAPHMRAGLAVEAISAAYRTGLVAGNAIMHTDRGGPYYFDGASKYTQASGNPAKHQPDRPLPRRRRVPRGRAVSCPPRGTRLTPLPVACYVL
jgi:hypothetical protein